MREIVFDTETTGLDNKTDRIIEIGGVELENHFPTGRSFHVFVNPDGKQVHPDALAVHGIDNKFLADKPRFKEIIDDYHAFFNGADLVAHNASFDVGFMNAEMARVGFPPIDNNRVIDTLSLARRRHPMGPNSLDALCKRYGIDNSKRTKHGALLDAELLAEVYIEMLGGRQSSMALNKETQENKIQKTSVNTKPIEKRNTLLASRVSSKDTSAHDEMIASLGNDAIWKNYK